MDAMKKFLVLCEVNEKEGKKKFSIKVKAQNSNYAAEKALSIIGSRHKKPRRQIVIKEIKEETEKK